MARARFIRPEFFTDEKVGALPYGARILFAGIWCHSDLRGVFEHSARQLRVLVFPFDEGLTSATVEDWLSQLSTAGQIIRFEVGGKAWGFVRKWAEHQDISTREVEVGSKKPAPPGWTMPATWSAIIERARVAGRLSKDSSWNGSVSNTTPTQNGVRTVLTQTQNPTPTSTPTPTATAAERGDPPAPAGDGLEGFLEDHLCKIVDRDGLCLMGEWRQVTKGMKPKAVREILEAAKPGIQWPSEFKVHRAARGAY